MNACFPVDILGSPLCPVDSVKNLGVWFDSDFSLSKHVQNVCKSCFKNSVTSDTSGSFELMMLLYLWLMLLLLVRWITATHFSGVSQSSIYINYSASKIVQPELYQTPVDTTALLLCLRNCIGYWLNRARCSRQPHLSTSFFTQVFLGIFLHIFLPTAALIVPGAVKVVVISLSYQSSTRLFINLSNSLVIVLLLMLPVFGMLSQMRFVPHPP